MAGVQRRAGSDGLAGAAENRDFCYNARTLLLPNV
jgi:hypothetical protein